MLDNIVLKVASRCNLNCSYCYMYNLGDTTYKNQPKMMSDDVVDQIIKRVKYYLLKNKQRTFQFIFHGGEPLLASKKWYQKFIEKANIALPDIQKTYCIQTNGVLYDKEWALHLEKLNIRVGFSWDGPKKIHDKFRVYRNNKGSYDKVVEGINTYKKYIGDVAGLSVINAEVTPSEYYDNIKEIGLQSVSLLLPNYHYDMKEEFNKFQYSKENVTYGKWLVKLFDIWWNDKKEDKPIIQFFRDFIGLILGYKLTSESFGEEEGNVLVIETNGDIETYTALKSIANGFTKDNYNVANNNFDDAFKTKLVKLAIKSHVELCETCIKGPISSVCGGGRINQRYSRENGFDNPSIYCNDIKLIVSHIQNTLLDSIEKEALNDIGLTKLEYGEF